MSDSIEYCDDCGAQLDSLCPSDATACSRIVGYRLEDGIDKAELYFLPGRPTQKTLDRMSDLIGDGWMVTGIIYSENEKSPSVDATEKAK